MTEQTPGGIGRSHVPGIDLLRFLAAASVFLFHLTWRVPGWSGVAPFGWVGVQVFFVISGFVIAQSADKPGVGRFAKGRFLRLYPAAWLCAAFSLAVLLVGHADTKSIGVLTDHRPMSVLNSLILVRGPALGTAYWTLPVELGFYLLVAVLLALRWFDSRKLGIGLIAWSGLYFAACTPHWLGIKGAPALDFGYSVLNASLLRFGFYFGIGALVFDAWRGGFKPIHIIALALASGLAALEIGWRADTIAGQMSVPPGPVAAVALSLWFFAMALMLMSARFQRLGGRAVRLLRFAGLATYPLYLLHETIGGSVAVLARTAGVNYSFALALAFVATLVAASAVVLLEKPLRAAMSSGIAAVRLRLSPIGSA